MTGTTSGRRFEITALRLGGLHRLERTRHGDERGFLERVFCSDELATAGWDAPVAQVNYTWTARRGTVRGLHFQYPPAAEMKLVSCFRGAVYDVAVDLRSGSETFGEWYAEELSAANGRALLIPEGYAHGFQALTDDVEMLYLHSAAYAPGREGGIHPEDPLIGVEWPLTVIGLSPRDGERQFLVELPVIGA
jgi:dTDP-4-dehydrorhamnose 3,5-epimerase